LWLACVAAAVRIWDDGSWDVLSARHVRLARDTGALSELPLARPRVLSFTCSPAS
jgi:hypothetical protein